MKSAQYEIWRSVQEAEIARDGKVSSVMLYQALANEKRECRMQK
jgi:hypothetical protein